MNTNENLTTIYLASIAESLMVIAACLNGQGSFNVDTYQRLKDKQDSEIVDTL